MYSSTSSNLVYTKGDISNKWENMVFVNGTEKWSSHIGVKLYSYKNLNVLIKK